jgi:hypothetical protein
MWTKAADQLLIKLWGEGKSMSDMADELGVTRGALAGRKRRLSEMGHAFDERETPLVFQKAAPPPPPKRNGVVHHDNGIEYLKLTEDGCKAILDKRGSDGLSMCCGKQREQGKPYCPGHVVKYGIADKRSEHGTASKGR